MLAFSGQVKTSFLLKMQLYSQIVAKSYLTIFLAVRNLSFWISMETDLFNILAKSILIHILYCPILFMVFFDNFSYGPQRLLSLSKILIKKNTTSVILTYSSA